jgi:hypothetical protein
MADGDGAENNAGNQRVTNAMLASDIKHLSEEVKAMRQEMRDDRTDKEVRMRKLEHWQTESETWSKQHEEVHEDIKREITGIKRLDSALIGIGALLSAAAGRFGQ